MSHRYIWALIWAAIRVFIVLLAVMGNQPGCLSQVRRLDSLWALAFFCSTDSQPLWLLKRFQFVLKAFRSRLASWLASRGQLNICIKTCASSQRKLESTQPTLFPSLPLSLTLALALEVVVQFGLIISRFVDNSGGQNVVCLLMLTPTQICLVHGNTSNAFECSDPYPSAPLTRPGAIVMAFTCTTDCY